MNRILLSLFMIAAVAGPAHATDISPDPQRYVAPSRPFDTIHTAVELSVDIEKQSIAGSVSHTLVSLRDDLKRIELNCVGLNVLSVTLGSATANFAYPVAGTRATSWFGTQDATDADDRLVIEIDPPAQRGDSLNVTVTYNGTPKKGLYWVEPEKGLSYKRHEVWSQGEGEDNRYWIPCHDYPDDKATFDGRFRVKRGLYALSNGRLVSRREVENGEEVFHWRLDQPQVSYLIMLAVARYDVHEETRNGVKLLYVVPPGTPAETVQRGYRWTGDILAFMEDITGIKYPFTDKYAQVVVQNFIYGGMENSTATVMNMRTLHDAGLELTRTEQGLVAHELAHQWWGDMVTCREWSHMWLNEGFATYYQTLFREHEEGDDAMRYEMFTRHRDIVSRDDRDARPLVTDFFNRRDARNNANIYIKGASVLHMLRRYFGDDLYHEIVRTYAADRMHQTAETADFARAVRETTGENMDWFFEQWAYLAGHPKLRVAWTWDSDASTVAVSVRQTQKTGGIIPLFRFPVDIEVFTGEGGVVHRAWVEREEHTFHFPASGRPERVVFDRGDWLLKELDQKMETRERVATLKNGDFIARVRAASSVGKSGGLPEVLAALIEILNGEHHWGLRREAAAALGRVRTDDARDALIAGLKLPEARVRLACAEALGSFRHDESVAAALNDRIAAKDPAWEVLAAAVTSIVSVRATNAGEVCVAALSIEGGRGVVRRSGLDGLAALHDTKAMDRIKPYCGPGNDREHHRHSAIAAYANLASHLDEERDRDRAADFLVPMLDDWYLRTRRAVIDALGRIGSTVAIPALRQAEATDPLEELRRQAGTVAGRIEAGAARPTIADVDRRLRELEQKIEDIKQGIEKH